MGVVVTTELCCGRKQRRSPDRHGRIRPNVTFALNMDEFIDLAIIVPDKAAAETAEDPKDARTLAQSPISDAFPPTGTAPPPRPATAPLKSSSLASSISEKPRSGSAVETPTTEPAELSQHKEKLLQQHEKHPPVRGNVGFFDCLAMIFCCRSDVATTSRPSTQPTGHASHIPGLDKRVQRPATSSGLASPSPVHPSVRQLQKQYREESLRGSRRSSLINLGATSTLSSGTSVSAAGSMANPVTQHIVLAPEREVQQQVHASQAAVAAAVAGGDEFAQHEAARLTSGELEQHYLLPQLSFDHQGRKCLVLDLDETLVHSSFKMIPSPDFIVPVEIEGQVHNVYVLKRPGVDEFMRKVGEQFEVVVFTASLAKYADPVLDLLDKHHVVHHRLFRESCLNYKGNYVKDLSQLGRDIRHTLIIDNSPASYILHPTNAIPVTSWFSDPHDTELVDMIPFLADLAVCVDDVTQVLDGAYEETVDTMGQALAV